MAQYRTALPIAALLIVASCEAPPKPLGATFRKVEIVGISPPDEDSSLRLGMRTIPAKAGYTMSVGFCPEWKSRIRMGQRFRLRFDRYRNENGLEYEKPAQEDLHERLCSALRNPKDSWMDGLPENDWRSVGEFP